MRARRQKAPGWTPPPGRAHTAGQGMPHQPDNIFAGTQVVSLVEVRGMNNSLGSAHPIWRQELQRDFERALTKAKLSERPGHEVGILLRDRSAP